MKKKPIIALALAGTLFALPFAACSSRDDESLRMPDETEPAIEETLPVLPAPEPEPPQTEQPAEEPQPEAPSEQPEPQEPAQTQTPEPSEPTVPTVVPEPQPKPKTVQYLLINSSGVNIRTGTGTSYSALGKADKGALLVYEGRSGNWFKTRYKDRTAYINVSYATIYTMPAASDKVENVIKRGFDFLGVTYVFGATRYHDGNGNKIAGFTTTAFDCSSYMQYIFLYGAGTLLNTTTRTQVSQGKAVTGDLKRGDLLFFTNASRVNNKGIERIGHVALYLGDNYILHTSSDYARAEQITSARWNYYITARRML